MKIELDDYDLRQIIADKFGCDNDDIVFEIKNVFINSWDSEPTTKVYVRIEK